MFCWRLRWVGTEFVWNGGNLIIGSLKVINGSNAEEKAKLTTDLQRNTNSEYQPDWSAVLLLESLCAVSAPGGEMCGGGPVGRLARPVQ